MPDDPTPLSLESAKTFASDSITANPRIRTVFVGFDFEDELNDTSAGQFIWMGKSGPAASAAEIVGGVGQCLKLAMTMIDRGFRFEEYLRETFLRLLSERKRLADEIEKQEAKLRWLKQEATGSTSEDTGADVS